MSSKISALPLEIAPTGLEQTVVAVDGANKRVTINAINSLVTKTSLGLSAVDNTRDMDKPISTSTANALTGKANSVHAHAMSDVAGLVNYISDQIAALSATLSATGHTHQIVEVVGLVTQLADKASVSSLQTLSQIVTDLNTAVQSKANIGHTHTTAEIQGLSTFVDNSINTALSALSIVTVGTVEW